MTFSGLCQRFVLLSAVENDEHFIQVSPKSSAQTTGQGVSPSLDLNYQ